MLFLNMSAVSLNYKKLLGSLETFMEDFKNKKEFIPIDKIKSIIAQLFSGLKYVHSKSNLLLIDS